MRLLKSMLMIFMVSATVACSNEEVVPNNTSAIPLNQVPSGTIVRVEVREETLTGYTENGLNPEAQIWWQHVGKTTTHDCPASYGEDGDTNTVAEETNFAFKNDGNLYKIDSEGEEVVAGSWTWFTDYSGIYINGVPYKFTALNANEVVYYNYTGSEECNTMIWEQMVRE